jgi:Sulfatase-modifying factor enzyme 1
VDGLGDRPAERESFLRQLAAIVESRWAQPAMDGPTRAARMAELKAFGDLVQSTGTARWNVESITEVWEGLPHNSARPPGWLPLSFDAVARSWLLGRDNPSARRAYLVEVLIAAFEDQSGRPDRIAFDRLAAWLVQRAAEPEVYHIAARLRVTRIVEEFASDADRLTQELHLIARAGQARSARLDLSVLAETITLRPRVLPLEPGWELARRWDELAIAACTERTPRWQRELARWLMTGLLDGAPGGVSLWAEKLNLASRDSLSDNAWDAVLIEFEARVAAGRLGDADLDAMEALAQWQENRRLSVEDFRRTRTAIPTDPKPQDQRIAARLQLATALRRCAPPARSVLPQVHSAPVASSPKVVARPWIQRAVAVSFVLGFIAGAVALANTWVFRGREPARPARPTIGSKERPGQEKVLPGPESEPELRADLGDESGRLLLHLRRGPRDFLPIELVVCEPKDHPGLRSRLYVASTETTFKQYMFVMKKLPAAAEKDLGDDYPVNSVTWTEAKAFCERIGLGLGLLVKEVRLPRDAEWRCLAGSSPPQPLSSIALFGDSNSASPDKVKGKRKAYPPGIYDLRGNVREWIDGSGPGANLGKLSESRVLEHFARGGAREDEESDLEQSRSFAGGDLTAPFVGFRIVVVPAAK